MRTAAFLSFVILLSSASLLGQEADRPDPWDVTVPRGETRTIDFTTNEGTWMSVDLSPDGEWVAFDLLGHIYRVPVAGGEAQALTQESGIAINIHPRISPDGASIAFISDRGGQNNLWVMDADGSNPRSVFQSNTVLANSPAWTPDGQYIVVVRQQLGGPGGGGGSGIWMYHRDGGQGIELVGRDQSGAAWPSPSADGRYVYFHVRGSSARGDAVRGAFQIRRLDLQTGDVSAVTVGEASQQVRSSSGGAYAPQVSPDGRWLAFARRIPDGTVSFKGHRFGPRTALWLRDLETGAERLIMDPIEIDIAEGGKRLRLLPSYAWSSDGHSIVLSQGGEIRRLDVASGDVSTIAFSAQVHREISEQAYAAGRITGPDFPVRFTRWQTASPNGQTLAFQAVGRIWLKDLSDGSPRRLTAWEDSAFEYAPAWSPDGQSIAFTTWDDVDGGHVWRVGVPGGAPVRLTEVAGEYIHPAWRKDGAEIVLARGGGATARGRGMLWNAWFEIVRLPATGGALETVVRVESPAGGINNMRNQIVRPSYGSDGRIYYPQFVQGTEGSRTHLKSVRPDGTEARTHVSFPFADEVVPSPDGRWVAFQEADNVYVAPMPPVRSGDDPILIRKKGGTLPVTTLSREGGLFPRWRGDSVLDFGSADRFFVHQVGQDRTDTLAIGLRVPRAQSSGSIALQGARIVTLEDRRVIEQGTVLVENGRIACVGDCDASAADSIVDVSGTTIVPGFIDVHSHNFREHRGVIPRHNYETAIFLAYGMTTVMDPSLWSQNIFTAAELIEAGEVVGPRVFSTGDPLYAGDGSRQDELASYEAAEASINRLASWGAISLKQYRQPRREQRQWVVDVARQRGLMVTAENGDLAFNLGLIMDGHTGWEHPMSYAPLYGDVAKFFGQAGAVYSATLVVGGTGPWNEEYFIGESEVWKDEKQRRFLPWRQLIPHTRRRMLRPKTDYSFPMLAQGLADIIAEGGYGAMGAHAQQNGIGSHWEIWMIAEGTGAMGALEVASLHGAYFIGREEDLGSIEVGKLADLVILNSNPLDDIRNTLDMRYVMKGGTLYDSDTLDEVWPRQRAFGAYYWLNDDALQDDDRPVDIWKRR